MTAAKMTEAQLAFLSRFVARGWLHATRGDKSEQDAVDAGLRKRYLRRELGEAHFTPRGRAALHPTQQPPHAGDGADTLNDIAADNEAARDDEFNTWTDEDQS